MSSTSPDAPTILIADDEPLVAAALMKQARRLGLHCLVDTTSERVLTLAREHRPALIILDLRQQVDGRDLLAELKRDPATRDIPVVILSGVEDQLTRHLCFELGAVDFEVKPFDGLFLNKVARLAGAPHLVDSARA